MTDLTDVSRETREDLERYVALLLKWNRTINLVGRATEADIWRRHIADSLQLLDVAPGRGRWVDFGSGAGLPGLPIALVLKHRRDDAGVLLIESDARKAAFLREAARITGAPARIIHDRIERVGPVADHAVTARALAPLDKLFGMAAPWLGPTGHAYFLKGANAESELTQARRSWTFHVKQTPSRTGSGGVILDISEVRASDGAD